MNKVSLMRAPWAFAVLSLMLASRHEARATISYSIAGSTYSENFDSLPKDIPTNNTTIETIYVNGWQDDTTTVAGDHVSLAGWYLYHPIVPTATPPAPPENGTNDHQRLRFGPGANTGGFWAFGSAPGAVDMALGSIGSTTVAANNANMYIALRLVNDTGSTLTSFTVTFDGEQWRDGASDQGETMAFDYSLTAVKEDWYSTAAFTVVSALNFTSPVVVSITGAQVDGNTAGLVAGKTATISGISWAPGAELWLRWADPQLPSLADDGLAIDNVRFSANLPLSGIPDAKLVFKKNESGQQVLEWQGATGYSYQVQHSADLQSWTSQAAPAPETNGIMSYDIPPVLLDDARRFFRLNRASVP